MGPTPWGVPRALALDLRVARSTSKASLLERVDTGRGGHRRTGWGARRGRKARSSGATAVRRMPLRAQQTRREARR